MKKLLPIILFTTLLWGCRNGAHDGYHDAGAEAGDTLTLHSNLLTMVRLPDGNIETTIANPWGNGNLQRLILVPADSALPEAQEGVDIIRVPVERAGVFSSVHTGGLKEIGAIDAIAGVADAAYFPQNDTIRALVNEGKIAYLGVSTAPSVERIAAAGIDVILRSPMEGTAAGALPPSVVPVEMADYMETSPIGRAEWLLLLGALTNQLPRAQAILDSVVNCYSDLHLKASLAQTPSPKVLTETEQSGVWYVPGTKSYMARFITDAGGTLPWTDEGVTGSVPMSAEAVAAAALDADVWLIRSYGTTVDAKALKAINPRHAAFKAVKDNNVWCANTAQVPLFDDIAFHPERLLADYIAIFHPDALPDHRMNYFTNQR